MERRSFLKLAGSAAFVSLAGEGCTRPERSARTKPATRRDARATDTSAAATLFLCGDVMTGRGIDQVLPHPGDPRLYERSVKNARRYVDLAVRRSGLIPRPVDLAYIWGQALDLLERYAPETRIINLETAVTTSGMAWPGKGIHYRMHPKNVPCLTAAEVGCCVLANNHVMDWGRAGLEQTLAVLRQANVQACGAGLDLERAAAPAVLPMKDNGRTLVFACGHASSGIPAAWAARADRPGVHLLDELSGRSVERLAERVRTAKRPGDVVVASIHWGGNWGYHVSAEHRNFAHALIDRAGVDLVHGHSSHHPKGIEVYNGRPILYGCGDFINDYEGIGGHERFRGDLSLMYFPRVDRATGRLVSLEMVPMKIRRFRLERASAADARWLADTLQRHSRAFGCGVEVADDETLTVQWENGP